MGDRWAIDGLLYVYNVTYSGPTTTYSDQQQPTAIRQRHPHCQTVVPESANLRDSAYPRLSNYLSHLLKMRSNMLRSKAVGTHRDFTLPNQQAKRNLRLCPRVATRSASPTAPPSDNAYVAGPFGSGRLSRDEGDDGEIGSGS